MLSTGQGVLGHNTYAYCLNNPVRYYDNGGTKPISIDDDDDASNDLLDDAGGGPTGGGYNGYQNSYSYSSTYYSGGFAKGNIYKLQNAAMRAAKRSVNIPLSQEPSHMEIIRMIGQNGRVYYTKNVYYDDKYIRNDFGGHRFTDATIPRHYNSGYKGPNGNTISSKLHFYY